MAVIFYVIFGALVGFYGTFGLRSVLGGGYFVTRCDRREGIHLLLFLMVSFWEFSKTLFLFYE